MKIMTAPSPLRLTQLQTLAESSLAVCRELATLQAPVNQLETVLVDFKASMNKPQGSSQRESIDKSRDQALQGFELHLKAELLYGAHSGPIISTLQQLETVMERYNNIRYLPMNDETAAIDNLLSELNTFNFAPLETLNLQRWLAHIEAENTEFKTASQAWLEQRVAADQHASPSSIAPSLRQSLNTLYAMLAAVRTINPSDTALKTAHDSINGLVKEYS